MVERQGREIALVERRHPVRAAENLARGLRAQIGHHRNPAAVAAEHVVHPVVTAHMREKIERERDIPGPGVGDA